MFRNNIAIQEIRKSKLLQLIRCLALIDRIASEAQSPENSGQLTKQNLEIISQLDNYDLQRTAKKSDPPLCLQLLALHHAVHRLDKKTLKPADIDSLAEFKKLRRIFIEDIEKTRKNPVGYLFALQFIEEIHTGFAYDKNKVAFIKSFESLNEPLTHFFDELTRIVQLIKVNNLR